MVKRVKKKKFGKDLKDIIFSPYFLPFSLFFFISVSAPVIYFLTKTTLDIRQRAAMITNGPISVNTDDISFKKAASEVLPMSTINFGLIILGVIAVILIITLFLMIKKRSTIN